MDVIEKIAWTPVIGRRIPFALSDDSPEQLYYCIGGGIELGESHFEALSREVFEETSARIIPGTANLIKYFTGPAHGQPAGTMERIWCYDAQHEGKLTPSGEVRNIAQFSTADKHRTTEVGRNILQWFRDYGRID